MDVCVSFFFYFQLFSYFRYLWCYYYSHFHFAFSFSSFTSSYILLVYFCPLAGHSPKTAIFSGSKFCCCSFCSLVLLLLMVIVAAMAVAVAVLAMAMVTGYLAACPDDILLNNDNKSFFCLWITYSFE